MQITFMSRDADAQQLRTAAIRRVRFAMRRLSWLAPHVNVQLSDVNGQRGGVDKRCHIEMTTTSGAQVIVTSMARDWLSALQSALTRASRALLNSLKRSKQLSMPYVKLAQPS